LCECSHKTIKFIVLYSEALDTRWVLNHLSTPSRKISLSRGNVPIIYRRKPPYRCLKKTLTFILSQDTTFAFKDGTSLSVIIVMPTSVYGNSILKNIGVSVASPTPSRSRPIQLRSECWLFVFVLGRILQLPEHQRPFFEIFLLVFFLPSSYQ